MKATRVKLMRQMRDDNERYRIGQQKAEHEMKQLLHQVNVFFNQKMLGLTLLFSEKATTGRKRKGEARKRKTIGGCEAKVR